MRSQTRRRAVGDRSNPNDRARQSDEMQRAVTNISTPGIVSLTVPIILPLAIVAILLAANISVDKPTMNSRLAGAPIVQQPPGVERIAQ